MKVISKKEKRIIVVEFEDEEIEMLKSITFFDRSVPRVIYGVKDQDTPEVDRMSEFLQKLKKGLL